MKPLILVGMNPRTRSQIPWESDAEIWTMNEAPSNEWLRRYDVLFQIHPRWDWERPNNIADANHPLYVKSLSGTCLFCGGAGKVEFNEAEKKCPYCQGGHYELPAHRSGKRIVMQDQNADVPGCIRLPIEALTRIYSGGIPYFTSTLAHMLVAAISLGYHDVTLYGFEMESDTEYAHQRACAEYWIGYGRALGMCIEAPGSGILKGEHYAYTSWAQGYRTRLGLRIDVLRKQIQVAMAAATKAEGALQALTPFKGVPEITPMWDAAFDDHFKRKNFVSFLQGTVHELENVQRMYDAYFLQGDGPEPGAVRDLLGLTYQLE